MEDIYNYIAHDSPLYARYQIESIYKSAERLRQFPESGRHIPEFP
ncbi:MAG: type II toxin-antitoxin system RelE/ParE family toxin [Nitrospirae bacterium]|nr:type II toxin-antitoxin system RelE/ParE family toxin [Nitrospirota bacterium]